MTLAILTFGVAYLLLVDGHYRRAAVVFTAVVFMLLVGVLTLTEAWAAVNWYVIGTFIGMLVLSDLFLASRMPIALAGWIARRTRSVAGAALGLAVLASALSLVLENVSVVLILAPIALALAKAFDTRAAPFLIGVALSSNLQAAALLIGDPPAMILGTYAGLSFNDFFWYHGHPGIFFAVECGAIASLWMLWRLFRKQSRPAPNVPYEAPRSIVPTLLLFGMVATLIVVSLTGRSSPMVTTWVILASAAIGWFWHIARRTDDSRDGGGVLQHLFFHRLPVLEEDGVERPLSRISRQFLSARERFGGEHRLLRALDWETVIFLACVFVLVEALAKTGVLVVLAGWFASVSGGSALQAYIILVIFAVTVSAFIDNVPFIVAMLPVASEVAVGLGIDPFPLYAGLLIGASVGGNITPIGASANIVAFRWINERTEEKLSFWGFVRYGLPFTITAVIVASTAGWILWN
ncbi:MAG: SLC13 family permease [Candidatus Uhrbacteria bacterium]